MPRGSMWGWHQLICALLKALIQVSLEILNDYIQISMSNNCFAMQGDSACGLQHVFAERACGLFESM